MNRNTENMRNRNNSIFNEIVLFEVKELISNGIIKNEIFGAGQTNNRFNIFFNRMSKYGNVYFTKKIRNKYLNNLLEKFEKGELDYIGNYDGELEFCVNSKGDKSPFIQIELSNPRDVNFRTLFANDFKNDMFSVYYKEGNKLNITFLAPNSFNVLWDKRKEYLRRVFEYMKMGFVTSIRVWRF